MDPATKEAAFGVMMASLPLGGMPSLQRNVMGGLEILTKQLYLVHKVSLAQEDIDKINVGVQELDTSNAFPEFVHYFEQMSEATLKEYPVASDKESQDMLAESDETLRKIAAGESGKSGYEIAEFFARRLAQEMSGFKREGIQELGDKTLMSLTKWRYMEKFLPTVLMTDYHKIVFRNEAQTRSTPVGVWYKYDRKKFPHIMLSMKHEFDWDENLLTVEVDLIVSSMHSRLRSSSTVLMMCPITLFSFGPRHGRIIQAFFDWKGMMIRKSKLIDLLDLSARPFDVFARFAASMPVGNARKYPTISLSQVGKPKMDSGLNFNKPGPNGRPPVFELMVDYSRLHDPKGTAEYEERRNAGKHTENNAGDSAEGEAETEAESRTPFGW